MAKTGCIYRSAAEVLNPDEAKRLISIYERHESVLLNEVEATKAAINDVMELEIARKATRLAILEYSEDASKFREDLIQIAAENGITVPARDFAQELKPIEKEKEKEQTLNHRILNNGLTHNAVAGGDLAPVADRATLATYFKPKAVGEAVRSLLQTVPDFISTVVTNPTVTNDTLTPTEQGQLVEFSKFNQLFADLLTGRDGTPGLVDFLTNDKVYKNALDGDYIDGTPTTKYPAKGNPFGYLVQVSPTGHRYLDPNVVSAMSLVMYKWMGSQSRSTMYNDDAAINMILGLKEDAVLDYDTYVKFRYVGTPRASVAESIGKEMFKALGIQQRKDVEGMDVHIQAKIEQALGEYALTTMIRGKFLVQNPVLSTDIATAAGKARIDGVERQTNFIRISTTTSELETDQGTVTEELPTARVDGLLSAFDEPVTFIDKVLNPGKTATGISFTAPPKYTEEDTRHKYVLNSSIEEVSPTMRKRVRALERVPYKVKPKVVKLFNFIGRDILLDTSGFVSNVSQVHKTQEVNTRTANDALVRELDSFNEFILTLPDSNLDTPIYFEHAVQSNNRARMISKTLTPQNSKVHRHLVGATAWTREVSTDKQRKFFKLAIVAALGFKIEKTIEESMAYFESEVTNNPAMQVAIDATKIIMSGADLTEAQVKALRADIANVLPKGTSPAAMLDVLTAMAVYSPTESFVTDIAIETDGITNGVALAIMQTMVDAGLQTKLAAAGVFIDGKTTNTTQQDVYDSYENLTLDVVAEFNKLDLVPTDRMFIADMVGELTNTNQVTDELIGVTKEGRKLSKLALMPGAIYGASDASRLKTISAFALKNFYAALMEAGQQSNKEKAVKELLDDLGSFLGIKVTIDNVNDLRNQRLPRKVENAFKQRIEETIGASVNTALAKQFPEITKLRNLINKASKVMFIAFGQRLERDLARAKEANGGRELSEEARVEVVRKLMKFVPAINHPSSSGLADRTVLMKRNKVREWNNPAKSFQIKYPEPVKGLVNLASKDGKPSKSTSSTVSTFEYVDNGVSTLPIAIQNIDAHMASAIYSELDILNLYDAGMYSIDSVERGTQLGNKAIYELSQNYSLVNEILASYEASIDSMRINGAVSKKFLSDVGAQMGSGFDVGELRFELTKLANEIEAAKEANPITSVANIGLPDGEYIPPIKEPATDEAELVATVQEVATTILENPELVTPAPDTTPYTAEMEEKAQRAYDLWSSGKGLTSIKTQKELSAYLNRLFGTNKSHSSMRRLFLGQIKKTELGSSSTVDASNLEKEQAVYETDVSGNNVKTVFEQMGKLDANSYKTESQAHQETLKEILDDLVSYVFNPLDASEAAVDVRVTQSGEVTFGTIKGNKVQINVAAKPPHVSNTLNMTGQETYAHEMVHAATRYAAEHSYKHRRELKRIFELARAKLTVKDFVPEVNGIPVTIDVSSPVYKAAQERYNYIFNNENYIDEFIAFGTTNEQFIKLLSDIKVNETVSPDGTLFGYAKALYQNMLTFISGHISKIGSNTTADAALYAVVQDMVKTTHTNQKSYLRYLDSFQVLNKALVRQLDKHVFQRLQQYNAYLRNKDSLNVGEKGIRSILGLPTVAKSSIKSEVLQQVMKAIKITEDNFFISLGREMIGITDDSAPYHALLRFSKRYVDQARKHVSDVTMKDLLDSFSQPITDTESEALLKVYLKSDISSITGQYTQEEIHELITDPAKLASEVTRLKGVIGRLSPTDRYYGIQAENLGYSMAQGTPLYADLGLNADVIVKDAPTAQRESLRAAVDTLATLYALQYTPMHYRETAGEVHAREYTANNSTNVEELNGIANILLNHTGFKQDSLTSLFEGNPMLMRKGYTKEIYDPNISIEIGLKSDEAEMRSNGYELLSELPQDPMYTGPRLVMYYSKTDGMRTRVKTTVSITNKKASGHTLFDMAMDAKSTSASVDTILAIQAVSDKLDKEREKQRKGNPTKIKETYLVPLRDGKGNIVNFRQVMSEGTKDTLLGKRNDAVAVLGGMRGSVVDKVNSREVNKEVLKLTRQDYLANYDKNPSKFVRIAADSSDPKYREIYNLLPEDMKQDMSAIWGEDAIYVREQFTRILFGFRKLTITDAPLISNMLDSGIAKSVGLKAKVLYAEQLWTDFVGLVKDVIVIKSVVVLKDNFISNNLLLWSKGVPLADIGRKQATALLALDEYMKVLIKRDTLTKKLNDDKSISITGKQAIENKLKRLNKEIETNPVKELIDEGLFQSIIEDIELTDNSSGIKNKLESVLSPKIDKHVPKSITWGMKQVLMTHDTWVYQTLAKATRYSDFIARYTLYQHHLNEGEQTIAKAKTGAEKKAATKMVKDAAILDVIETFINYDVPTSPQLQWLNDTGVLMFTKFLFRIQKVILKSFMAKPANMVTIETLGLGASITDSNLLTTGVLDRIQNPFVALPDDLLNAGGVEIALDAML